MAASFSAGCEPVVAGLDQRTDKRMPAAALPAGQKILLWYSGADLAGLHTRKLGWAPVTRDLVNDAADAPLFAHNIRTVAAYSNFTSLMI